MTSERNPLEEALSQFLRTVAIGLLRSEQFCRQKGHAEFVESFFRSMRKIEKEVPEDLDRWLPVGGDAGFLAFQDLLNQLERYYRDLPAEAPPALKDYLH